MPLTNCGFSDVPGGASGADLLVTNGPTLFVDIGFDAEYRFRAGQIPIAGMRGVQALVDTGATESCIDYLLAAQLNLPVIDRRTLGGVRRIS